MKNSALVILILAVAFPVVASELPLACPTTFNSEVPPIIPNFNNGWRFADGSMGYFSQFVCRDGGQVAMWTWQTQNCTGRCEAAMFPQEADNMFPPGVPHVCEGCLTMASTPLPLACAITLDPQGLGRPAILEMSGIAGSRLDGSRAVFSRFTCRDTGEVVMWTWQVDRAKCTGPCEIAFGPARDAASWPQNVPHLCEGCMYERHRAAR